MTAKASPRGLAVVVHGSLLSSSRDGRLPANGGGSTAGGQPAHVHWWEAEFPAIVSTGIVAGKLCRMRGVYARAIYLHRLGGSRARPSGTNGHSSRDLAWRKRESWARTAIAGCSAAFLAPGSLRRGNLPLSAVHARFFIRP